MSKLDTNNPDHMVYESEELCFTVLGGIKLEGLDRLRVTLKIEVTNRQFDHFLNHPDLADLALRHNLDLYNDMQVEKLVRRAAERLEVGSSQLAKGIADITDQLEKYRLVAIEQSQNTNKKEGVLLSPDEREVAESFLKEENLLKRTNELIGQSGVVGEEYNRLLMYLIFTSRKRDHPLHIISLGSSGIGKTHLQEKVGELIPEEDKVEITTLSENAFYYFERRALSHKLILIEDLDGAENSLYALRELQSKKRISKTIAHKNSKGDTATKHLVVEGPVSVSGCTTREYIYEDNANRSFLIYIDESSEQDENIMHYQRMLSAGHIDEGAEQSAKVLLQTTQRVLKPVKVVNPYAEQLKLPPSVFKPRRTNSHYLQFIELLTFYHQYQRVECVDKASGEIYIETTLEDIFQANTLMKEVLLRKSDELSGACRNYFERLKSWLSEEQLTAFTNKEARIALKENHSNQKRYMLQLQLEGFIRKSSGDKKKGYHYEVMSVEEYEKLRFGIGHVLDAIYEKLKEEVQSSVEVHRVDEPHNGAKESLKGEKGKKLKSSSKRISVPKSSASK